MSMTSSTREFPQLGDVIEKVESWNPLRAPADQVFRYIDLSAVDQKTKTISQPQMLRCSEAPSRARQLVRAGDVLVSTVRPNLNGVARVPNSLDGATASTGFCVLRPSKSRVDSSYLFHWVKTPAFVAEMVRMATGANYPAVSDRIVFESHLPLPSLPEQRRIAKVLDRAEGVRATRHTARKRLDVLRQAVFVGNFKDYRWLQSSPETVSLDSVCDIITDGTHKTPDYRATGVPFVTVKNIVTGELDLSTTKFISEQEHMELIRRAKPEPGDILVSKDGTIGVPCLVSETREFSIFVSVALLKPKRSIIDSTFLVDQLRSEWLQTQIRSGAKGIAIRHLHLSDFRKLRIVLPPIEQQLEYTRKAKQIETMKRAQARFISEFDRLFASLQHRAFRGEL